MDCSNPVRDSSRATLRDIIGSTSLRRRQELTYLKALAEGTERMTMDSLPERDTDPGERARELSELLELIKIKVDPSSVKDVDFLEKGVECPVSGLLTDGIPIHPSGIHSVCVDGVSCTTAYRTFGGCNPDRAFLASILAVLPKGEIEEAASKYVYTHGEACGFLKRLKEQTVRKCVSVRTYPYGGLKNKKAATKNFLSSLLKKRMPVKAGLPDWGEEILDQLLDIETSKISSAGPPYWRLKPDAMKDLMETTLPLLVERIKSGKMDQLYKEQREMFIVECKNKLDRYEPGKLADKVRPYYSLPFHFQVLFSMLSQPFSKKLALFHEDPGSANAYGLSWAHGGAQKCVEWARNVKKGEMAYYCYGDDTDLYWRDSEGRLWRVSPDFRQMDGSVDRDTVETVVDYIISSFAEQHPDKDVKRFWEEVGGWWIDMATNPEFLIHGPTVYRKSNERFCDGLMTGVVGTTIFDTAKAIFSYEAFRDTYLAGDRTLVEEKKAVLFFRKLGLEVKEGTWAPEIVREDPIPDTLFAESKFLGMRLMYRQGPNAVEPVPHLRDEEWLEMILSPKDDPLLVRKNVSYSNQQRTIFDRCRGYLVTGAYHSEVISKLLGYLINRVPSELILMAVQADLGRGEKPEFSAPLGGPEGDFSFPTSEGVPTSKWCDDLYFSPDNQWGEEWTPVFPNIKEAIGEWKRRWRNTKPVLKVVSLKKEYDAVKTDVKAVLSMEVDYTGLQGPPCTMVDLDPDTQYPSTYPTLTTKPKPPIKERKGNKRSKIMSVETDEQGGVIFREGPKKVPTLEQVLSRMFAERELGVVKLSDWVCATTYSEESGMPPPLGYEPESAKGVLRVWAENQTLFEEGGFTTFETPVGFLHTMAGHVGRTPEDLEKKLRALGYFVLGRGSQKIVLPKKLDAPDPETAKEVGEQDKENQARLLKGDPPPTLAQIVAKTRRDAIVEVPLSITMGEVYLAPITDPVGSRNRDMVSYFYSVAMANKTKAVFLNEVFHKDSKALVKTTLTIGGVVAAERMGNSNSENKREISRAMLSQRLRGEAIKTKNSHTQKVRKTRIRKHQEDTNWADEVEDIDRTERARLYYASQNKGRVLIGVCKGAQVIAHIPPFGEKIGYNMESTPQGLVLCDEKKRKLVRRKNESISGFMHRVRYVPWRMGNLAAEFKLTPPTGTVI